MRAAPNCNFVFISVSLAIIPNLLLILDSEEANSAYLIGFILSWLRVVKSLPSNGVSPNVKALWLSSQIKHVLFKNISISFF